MNHTTESIVKEYLEVLNWRYATKKFDPAGIVPDEELSDLLDAVRLSPSSYGLQPYKVLVIRDEEIRERLRPACWDQSQITDASHVLVLASKTDFSEDLIDSYVDEVSATRGVSRENLNGYADFMKSKLLHLPSETKAEWTARQAYIALGNLLSAAAVLKIDACPMEGFDPQQVDEILDLKKEGLTASVIVPIGYRSDKDPSRLNKKVRRPESELFVHI